MDLAKITSAVVVASALITSQATAEAQTLLKPDETFLYAQKDSCDLYMDVYYPADGSIITYEDMTKPVILFMFGGGFKEGQRDAAYFNPWFKLLTDDGYTVVSIDYRLGLKDVDKMGLMQAGVLENAIHMAVEDLFSATNFIIDNAVEVDLDPYNIVISGSSAGAITVMQAEWEICNLKERASVLPQGYNYRGVMSFAGAIFSREGRIRYRTEPCPTLMLHGTADKIVNYRKLAFLNLNFAGTACIAPAFEKGGFNYNVLRYEGHGHEISSSMAQTYAEQKRFLETNVMKGERKTVDALVNDPYIPIPDWGLGKGKDIYKD